MALGGLDHFSEVLFVEGPLAGQVKVLNDNIMVYQVPTTDNVPMKGVGLAPLSAHITTINYRIDKMHKGFDEYGYARRYRIGHLDSDKTPGFDDLSLAIELAGLRPCGTSP